MVVRLIAMELHHPAQLYRVLHDGLFGIRFFALTLKLYLDGYIPCNRFLAYTIIKFESPFPT